jgi:hypothetical protein
MHQEAVFRALHMGFFQRGKRPVSVARVKKDDVGEQSILVGSFEMQVYVITVLVMSSVGGHSC